MTHKSHLLIAAAAATATAIAAPASAQLRPPAGGGSIGDYSLHDFAAKWMMQQDDVPEIEKYRAANEALAKEQDERPRTVMLGDSVTAHWELVTESSASRRFVNRGIGGQNSSQMLLRFQDDVVALRPSVVAILAGTNDLRAYVGAPESVGAGAFARIRRNLTAMADIADARGIAVVLGTIPPVGNETEKVARDAGWIVKINAWIRAFAEERGYPLADYHAALVESGAMPSRYSEDGIHPNGAGYSAMAPALMHALAHAQLRKPQ